MTDVNQNIPKKSNETLKILIVSQYFYPEVFRINEVAQSLADKGHQVSVLTGIPNYPFGKIFKNYKNFFSNEKWKGIDIYRIPIIPRGSASGFFLFLNYISFVIVGLIFAPVIFYRHRLNVVYVYGTSPIFQALPGLLIARIKGAKCILNVQDIWPESILLTGHIKNQGVLRFIRILVNKIYTASDLIVSQSIAMQKKVMEVTGAEKSFFIPNSVDFFNKLDKKITIDNKILDEFECNRFNILYAGNVGKAQGLVVLIDAAKLLLFDKRIKFLIAGDGSELENIKNLCTQNNLTNVSFLGSFAGEIMPILYNKASFLFLSLKKHDALSMTIPNKLQVYMSMGKPIIGSIDGEASRIIAEANAGLIAPAGNAEQLAAVIRKAIAYSADERGMLGLNGRNYFKNNFDNDLVINNLVKLMKKCIQECI
jgi:glycosyltransferase involved in cell wall biosynthesis